MLVAALKRWHTHAAAVARFHARYDLLLTPTLAQPPLSLPLHWTPDGLPLGVQLVGDLGAEPLLVRVAAQLERARPRFDRVPSEA